MSVEDRLRTGLRREADLVAPRVEREYAAVVRRHGRRRAALVAGWLSAAAATAAAVTTVTVVLDRPPVPVAPTGGPSALVGEYVVDVPDRPVARQQGMVGRWVVVVQRDGSLELIPPPAYRGVVSGAVYQVEGGLLRTNAFLQQPGCQAGADQGVYRWNADRDSAGFARVSEDCPARRVLFDAQPWERVR